MDQWRSKFSESFSLDRYWSIECSSLSAMVLKRKNPLLHLLKSGSGFEMESPWCAGPRLEAEAASLGSLELVGEQDYPILNL